MDRWESERKLLWEVVQEMARRGLVSGSNGNASLRLHDTGAQDLILITPSQIPYGQLTPEDLAVIDFDGAPVEERHTPSSETPIHLQVYKQRPDVGAVMHTHSPFASVAAVAGMEIPPIVDETVFLVGGAVKVAEYGFPATEELAERVCLALEHRNAVLIRNHGLLGVGQSPQEALDICHLVERVAQIFIYASLLGKANSLPNQVVQVEEELFRMRQSLKTRSGGNLGNDS